MTGSGAALGFGRARAGGRRGAVVTAVVALLAGLLAGEPALANPTAVGGGPGARAPEGTVAGAVATGNGFACAVRTAATLACWGDGADGQTAAPTGSFTDVSVNGAGDHACALRTSAAIACWGAGDGALLDPPAGAFTQVAAGSTHNCGLRAAGSVACWGDNAFGQRIPPLGEFRQVASGVQYSCGIRAAGTVACWGRDLTGVQDPPSNQTFVQLATGPAHACGVRTDHLVQCWGVPLGLGADAPPAGFYRQVALGGFHGCAIRTNGTLACWGENFAGQASPPAGTFTRIAAGTDHSCGVRSDGTVTCWGFQGDGRLDVPAGTFANRAVASGGRHTCAIGAAGTVTCWGDGADGRTSPPAGTFVSIATGADDACGIRSDGTIACWGRREPEEGVPPAGQFLQLDLDTSHACAIGILGNVACWGADGAGQASPPGGTFTQVAVGGGHTCAVRTDGTAVCWGSDSSGQRQAPGGTFLQVSAGFLHSCGLHVDGTLECWGGMILTPGVTPNPVPPPPSGPFSQLSSGANHACAVGVAGLLRCWGANGVGQAPDTRPGAFAQVSGGALHSCGVLVGGTVDCWGFDDADRLGGPPLFTSPPPPDGDQDPYLHQFTVSGGLPARFLLHDTLFLPIGLTLDSAAGTLSGTPAFEGNWTGTIRATNEFFTPDGFQDFDITIDFNDPPAIEADAAAVTVSEGAPAANTGTVSDPDAGQPLALTATVGSVVAGGDGTWSWTLTPGDGPDDSRDVTVTVTDPKGLTDSVTFALTVENVAPSADAGGPYTATVNGPLVLSGSASDPAGDRDTLRYAWDFDFDGVTFAPDAQGVDLRNPVTSYGAPGTYTVALRVEDEDGDSSALALASVDVASAYRTAVLDSGPALYWRLGERDGTVAADASGHGRDGTYGPGWSYGEPGAVAGDPDTAGAQPAGTAAGVSAPSGTFNPGARFTVAVWLQDRGDTPDASGFVRKWDDARGRGWGLFRANDEWVFTVGTRAGQTTCSIGPRPAGDGWHFVAAVVRPDKVAVHLDGVKVRVCSFTRARGGVRTGAPLALLGRPDTPAAVDELTMWDRPLPTAELARIHQVGRTG